MSSGALPPGGEIETNRYDFLMSWANPDKMENQHKAEKLRRDLPKYLDRIRASGLKVKEEKTASESEVVFLVGTNPAVHPRTGAEYEPLLEDFADRLNIPMPHRPDEDGLYGGYLPFKKEKREEYLPEVNSEGMEKAFFGPATRQRLIMTILTCKFSQNPNQRGGAQINIKSLRRHGLLKRIFPLHDTVRKAHLLSTWGNLKKMFSKQPLDEIREYFGPKVAMYFAWIGYYTFHLWLPTLLGLIVGIFGLANSQSASEGEKGQPQWDNVLTPLYALFMIVWATVWNEMWKRYSNTLADRWGQMELNETEEMRDSFVSRIRVVEIEPAKGVYNVQTPVRVRKHGDVYEERYFPTKSRWCIYAMSSPVFALLIAGVIVSVYFTLTYRDNRLEESGGTLSFGLSMGLAAWNAGIIVVFNLIYKRLAVILNSVENYRTDSEYENALIIKTFFFQFVNSYISLYFIAFVSTRQRGGDAKMQDLFTQLLVILFLKQIVGNVIEMGVPWIRGKIASCKARGKGADSEQNPVRAFEREINLAPYETPFSDYLEIVVQFGYMVIFSVAFPFGPAFSLLNNVFEIRLDARRMLADQQRPVAKGAKDIGSWQVVMETTVFLASVSNAGLVAFVSQSFFKDYLGLDTISGYDTRIVFIIIEHCLIALIIGVKYVIPDMPGDVARKIELEKYTNTREYNLAQGYLEDDDEDEDDDAHLAAPGDSSFHLPAERPRMTSSVPANPLYPSSMDTAGSSSSGAKNPTGVSAAPPRLPPSSPPTSGSTSPVLSAHQGLPKAADQRITFTGAPHQI